MKPSFNQLWEMDKNHFIHPYTNFATFKKEGSQLIAEASGNHVIDTSGKTYLDAIAGLWCVNIGHGRAEMADAIAEQVGKMQYYNPFGHTSNLPAAQLADVLVKLMPPSLNHVYYSCGGSTANDTAIRIVHYYNNLRGKPNKKKIISRLDAYHGSTYVAANLTGIHATKNSFDRIADDWISHISAANMYRRPIGAEQLDESNYCDYLVNEFENHIVQLGADNVAAFIAEPIMGAGGVYIAPANYHQRMHQVCQRYDILYIADEVVTAFGRVGEWNASQQVFGMQPDIITLAKGITSGYIPLGATLLSDEIYDVISQPQRQGGTFSMGFTYSGHAVACAAALKNIEIMQRENLLDKVKLTTAPYLHRRAKKLLNNPVVGDVRGKGLMMAVEFVSDKEAKTPFAASLQIGAKIFKACMDNGVIVRPIGNCIVISPPLTLSNEEVDQIIDSIQQAISSVNFND